MLISRASLFFLFFFILFQARSQNLVPNPGFENLWLAPCNFTLPPSFNFNYVIQDWTVPSEGTSDIYSNLVPTTCFANCFSSNIDAIGKQAPRTGDNMCGFFTYGNDYREYLQVKLTTPLIIGQKYYAEIFVSSAEHTQYDCNNIGMYFSTQLVWAANSAATLPFTPQIKNSTIISDNVNWVKISGTFIATDEADYLIIGNFNDEHNTSTIQKTNYYFYYPYAYYYIDDVLVKSVCNPHDSSAAICKGNSITLDFNDSHITGWSLASAPNTILSNRSTYVVSPNITSSYIAHYDCDETSIFEVIVDPLPTFNLGKDTSICEGEIISFDATTEHANYLWQDGSKDPTYTIRATGQYSVTITNGCRIHEEVFINVVKPATFNFGTDSTICAGEVIQFDATTNGATYLWQDGSTNPIYTASDSGYYAVTIKNSCGITNKSIYLNPCCTGSIIPNLITPNGDNMNETFEIDCFGNGDYELVIYNRWGSIVYHSTSYLNNWGGENVSDGIYYYVIRYKNKSINNGWVQVLR